MRISKNNRDIQGYYSELLPPNTVYQVFVY